jgi:hypothetical protein
VGGSVGHSEWLGGGDESDCSVGLEEYGPILILIRLGIGSGIAIAIAGDVGAGFGWCFGFVDCGGIF